MGNLLLQGALGMGVGLGGAPELHLPADVVAALAAQLARLAGLADLEGHAVARLQRGDGRAHGGDDAGRLVAQRQGLPHEDVAVAEVAEVVQVRAAEAGRLDGHLDMVGAERGQHSFFLGRNVSLGPGGFKENK